MAVADIEFDCKTGLIVQRAVDNTASPTDIVFVDVVVLNIPLPSGTGPAQDVQRSCVHVA